MLQRYTQVCDTLISDVILGKTVEVDRQYGEEAKPIVLVVLTVGL